MGKSGAARVKSGNLAYATAMQNHEDRVDYVGARRRVREVPPLIYSPYAYLKGPDPEKETRLVRNEKDRISRIDLFIVPKTEKRNFTIWDALQAHIKGARKSKAATKDFLHAFIQYPTDLEVTSDTERLMLCQAVEFVNSTYGGNAVFHARLDRDEAGRHGVDVFFAPRYEKPTKKAVNQWVSLSKFSKENARKRYGQREKKNRSKVTGDLVTALDKNCEPVMVWNDSGKFQGRALQDAWLEHLQDRVNIKWAVRGKRKQSYDPDRRSPEEYAAQQEERKLMEELDRQLKKLPSEPDTESLHVEAANKMIERADQLALAEARKASKYIEEEAEKAAIDFMDRLVTGAKADALAITQSMLSKNGKEFAYLRKENRRLEAEVIRQGQIIRLVSTVMKAVLPPNLLATVRKSFDLQWAKLRKDKIIQNPELDNLPGPSL